MHLAWFRKLEIEIQEEHVCPPWLASLSKDRQLISSQLFLHPYLNSDVEEYRKAQLAAWEAKAAPTLE